MTLQQIKYHYSFKKKSPKHEVNDTILKKYFFVTVFFLILPERSESSQQPEDSEDTKYAGWSGGKKGHDDINKWNDDKWAVHDVPPRAEVCCLPIDQALGNYLAKRRKSVKLCMKTNS